MGFKQRSIFSNKGLSRVSSSPLNNNDLSGAAELSNVDLSEANITNTASVKDLSGKDFATERIITTNPSKTVEKVETDNEKFLASFDGEYKKAQESGFPGTLPEYIKQKEKKLGYVGSEVKQKRDYNVENKPEYKIDKNTGKSYITKPIKGSTIRKREYHYPTYNTGHHEKGTLVSTNEMLGNLREKFPNKKANKIYEAWILKNTGKPVKWKTGSKYSRNKPSSQSENKGKNWKNVS